MNFTDRDLEISYQDSLKNVLFSGDKSTDRTGVGTTRLQHAYFEWQGMACMRMKKLFPKKAMFEILWMMMGKNDIKSLKEKKINYWDSWVREDGTFGRIYGPQMRNFNNNFDQLQYVVDLIKNEPDSRRMIISLWNPSDLEDQALPPCHCFYQFTCVNDILHLHVYQRSADAFLGVPYNFVMSSTMLDLIANYTGKETGKVHYTCADFHIYDNHIEAVDKYLVNSARNDKEMYGDYDCPLTVPSPGNLNLDEYLEEIWKMNEIYDLKNYKSHEFIGAPVAV